jgi:predicted site-specific integrase-resolvase
MPNDIPQLLTLIAVAKALCISPHTVRSWVRNGRLCPIRLCRRLLFHPEEISRFLAKNSSSDGHARQSFRRPECPDQLLELK